MKLDSRIARLERSKSARSEPAECVQSDPPDLDDFSARLNLLLYEDDQDRRERLLSLEERLALVRRDAAAESARPNPSSEQSMSQPQSVRRDRVPAAAARELETRILERDRVIDPDNAHELRTNLRAYLDGAAPLCELPRPIMVDEETFASAMTKCPPRKSLPLDAQLDLALTDLDEARQETGVVNDSLQAVRIKIHEQIVRDIEKNIADRAR